MENNAETNILTVEQNNERKVTNIHPHAGFVFVPKGYTIVRENIFTGRITVKRSGLRFFFPWFRRTFVYESAQTVDYKKEEYRSKEGYLVQVDSAITYKISNPALYYVEENAMQQLNILMSGIMRRLVCEYSYAELTKIDIDIMRIDWVFNELSNFSQQYGIMVTKIAIQQAELTGDLRKSQEEDELTRAKNRRNIATAEAQRDIAKLDAEARKAQGDAEAYVLSKKVEELLSKLSSTNMSSEEQIKILREVVRGNNTNLTVIESGSASSDFSNVAAFASLNQALQNQPLTENSQNTESQENTESKENTGGVQKTRRKKTTNNNQ